MKTFALPMVELPHVDFRALEAHVDANALVTVYDAVDVAAIPANAQFILAYLDGNWPTLDKVKQRFPNAFVLTITTNGSTNANIADCESGDLTPPQAAAGYASKRWGTVYSAKSVEPEIAAALGGLPFSWWAADPTGVAHLVDGSVATQFAWPGYGSPGNFDISLATPAAFGWNVPTPAPAPAPLPQASRQDQMTSETPQGGTLIVRPNGAVFAEDGAIYYGGMNGHPLNAPIIAIASTLTGKGYWLLGADGGIFNFGDAKYLGPLPKYLNSWGIGVGHGAAVPLVGIQAMAGGGYKVIADRGTDGTVPALYRITPDGAFTR